MLSWELNSGLKLVRLVDGRRPVFLVRPVPFLRIFGAGNFWACVKMTQEKGLVSSSVGTGDSGPA
jgi:hypothetical protein